MMVKTIAGNGRNAKVVGPACKSSFGQPYSICMDGRSAFVLDVSYYTITLLTGIQDMCTYFEHLRMLYYAFSVYTETPLDISLTQSIELIDTVKTYYEQLVLAVNEKNLLTCALMFPHAVLITSLFIQFGYNTLYIKSC